MSDSKTETEDPHQCLCRAEDSALPLEERFHSLAASIDRATDLEDLDVLKRTDAVAETLIALAPDLPLAAELAYCRANAWSARRYIRLPRSNEEWDWEGEEIHHELLHLREAAYHPAFDQLDPMRQCQIETNLGNLMSHVGRFVDAVACWDAALRRIPTFAMALGNRGHGLSFYARALYDPGHAGIMLLAAYDGLTATLDQDPILDNPENHLAIQFFSERRDEIAAAIDVDGLRAQTAKLPGTEVQSPEEVAYRRWCLHHRLFLNPLNDLGPLPVADHDVLTTPAFVAGLDEPPSPVRFFNVMKQEYVSARFMLYTGSRSEDVHFSDRGVLLYNTLDYPSHGLAVEQIKSAFRTAYSLFDKIGQFVNHYWRFGIKQREVTLRRVWYQSHSKQRKLREEFLLYPNWPLRGLFWLSRDLFDPLPGFRTHTDPDAQNLADMRNRIEHGFLAVHEFEELYKTVGMHLPDDHPLQKDRNLYAISRYRLTAKTLRLLQLARAALIYLSLAMYAEERRRAADRGEDECVVPMDLGTLDDDWKR